MIKFYLLGIISFGIAFSGCTKKCNTEIGETKAGKWPSEKCETTIKINPEENLPPSLNIDNVSITEGNSGTKTLTFTVTQSASSTSDTTFYWATNDGTATAGSDYVVVSSTQATIAAGTTTVILNVTINGDTAVESDEAFTVTISSPTNTTISTAIGTGTITNDDAVASWSGTKQLGIAGTATTGFAVTADALTNLYVGGYTGGGLDGNTLTGITDFFVTKYNSSGIKQWTRQLGVSGKSVIGRAIVSDSLDNVYLTGRTEGGLDGNVQTGTYDFFVTKYNSSGVKQWTRQLGPSGQQADGYCIAADANDNIYVSGFTMGGIDGNPQTGTIDLFVIKYNSSGVKQWIKQLGIAAKNTVAQGVATDSNNNIYLAGYTNGDLDGNALTGTQDFFVTKYDSSGVKQWTKQLGVATKNTIGSSVKTDTTNSIYISGLTTGGLDGNSLAGTSDSFITKYDSSGVKQWTRQFGVSSKMAEAQAITSDASNNVYSVGITDGGLDGNILTGTKDFFITKYDSSGVKQWTKQLGVSSKDTTAYAASSDAANGIFVTGFTYGGLDGNVLTGTADLFVTKYNSSGTKQ